MKCNEIYEAAMAHIGLAPYAEENEEYKVRAPYIICALCYEMAFADREYRRVCGKDDSKKWEGLELPLSADFPLSDRFSSSAAYCLASSLVAKENSKLSDELYMKYSKSMKDIYSEIPAMVRKTVNVYPE